MEPFKHNKKALHFSALKGEILDSEKFTETRVSSRGGGGHVGRNGGVVNAPTVTSKSIIHHHFWVRTEDGQEQDVKFEGIDIPLRAGQKITLISAAKEGETNGRFVTLINHSAGKHWWINDGDALNQRFHLEGISGKSALIAFTLGTGLYLLTHSVVASAVLGIGYLVYRGVVKYMRIKKLEKSLDLHLSRLVMDAY